MQIDFKRSILSAFLITILISCGSKEKDAITASSSNTTATTLPKVKVEYKFKGDYSEAWRKVDSLQNRGQYKSALTIVETIFSHANVANNSPEVVKATIYSIKLKSFFEEEEYIMALTNLDSLAKVTSFPTQPIMHSLAASFYWGYYQQNSWRYHNRTDMIDFDAKDIRTWSLDRIIEEVDRHYQASLALKEDLSNTYIADFQEMLVNRHSSDVQPSLYDLLAHRALSFYQNSQSSVIRAADQFTFSDKDFYAGSNTFSKMNLNQYDSTANAVKALKIYQSLTRIHLENENTLALIYNELLRLEYVFNNTPDSNTKYINALERFAGIYKKQKEGPSHSHQGVTEINFKLASLYNSLSVKGDSITNDYKIKAIELCNESIKDYPKSFGAQQCQDLIESIQQTDLTIQGEKTYRPNQSGIFSISYKNLEKVHFRLIKVDDDFFFDNMRNQDEMMKAMSKITPIQSWSATPIAPKDYHTYSTELTFKGQDFGHYILLASTTNSFETDPLEMQYMAFWVSNLSNASRKTQDGKNEIYVLNSQTGEPVKGAQVKLFRTDYNYTLNKATIKNLGSYTTNTMGIVTVGHSVNNRNFSIKIKNDKDCIIPDDSYYQYQYNYTENAYTTSFFYTDRAIYRPGQKIHFKGILIKRKGDQSEIVTNKKTTILLKDVNWQNVGTIDVTTNEYGSFSGTFEAPTSGLLGNMSLYCEYGSKSISVEEYKRPRFEVSINPVEGETKLDQSVTVKGSAKSYAGAPISDAKVAYRVVRSPKYYGWYFRSVPSFGEVEISNGFVSTDESGEFKIEFDAKSDESKYQVSSYNYRIEADVTDITGETHSQQTSITIGVKSYYLNATIHDFINLEKLDSIGISATNHSGQSVTTSGTIELFKRNETEVLPNRLWSQQDVNILSDEEYNTHKFNDLNPATYSNKALYTGSFSTSKKDAIPFATMKGLAPGNYKLVAKSKDKYGEEIYFETTFTVFNPNNTGKAPTSVPLEVIPSKSQYEPGETAQLALWSGIKSAIVLYELKKGNEILERKLMTLNESQQNISIPIKAEYRGNISAHFYMVNGNRQYSKNLLINVPYTNKELDVELITYRDKMLPGSTEKWQLKITGSKKEKVASELLLSMYDASLDEFRSNSFDLSLYPTRGLSQGWNSSSFSTVTGYKDYRYWQHYYSPRTRTLSEINMWGYYIPYNYRNQVYYNYNGYDGDVMLDYAETESIAIEEVSTTRSTGRLGGAKLKESYNFAVDDAPAAPLMSTSQDEAKSGEFDKDNSVSQVKARSNLAETAFFMPHLKTDADGNVIVEFTMPEALTKWKMIGLAHSKDLRVGNITSYAVTQKELMVTPNLPRFLRETDEFTFSSKIDNLTEEDFNATVELQLIDPFTQERIDNLFNVDKSMQTIAIKSKQSGAIEWKIKVPFDVPAVIFKVVAKAGKHSDGEESPLPILSNRILVTESMPMPSRGIGSTTFRFEKLLQSGNNGSMKHHGLTLEYTSNPAWYAIQSMPYLMEFPHECSEQTFARYYANAIGSHIVNSSPKIKDVFESWKNSSPEAFLSNLQKNEELKAVVLEETPWVLDAVNENEQKKRVALLFDFKRMDKELNQAFNKLMRKQLPNGGWPWFNGMRASTYITQHILAGFGHLDRLGVRTENDPRNHIDRGFRFLDKEYVEAFARLKYYSPNYLKEKHLSYTQIEYLYARSFYPDLKMDAKTKEVIEYYEDQMNKYWKDFDLRSQGMIALYAHRNNKAEFSKMIIASIKERAIDHPELGTYWKDNVSGYYWHQAPIETQSLLIEAFHEITDDQRMVEDMKVWLLKNKQTNRWETTKATSEACYALLMQGTDLLSNTEIVEILINDKPFDPAKNGAKVEAGTGYFKKAWKAEEVKPEMGKITVNRKSEGVSWGALYWQYFEDMDKVTSHETPLKLNKKLFKVVNTSTGPKMELISATTKLEPGDKIRVRIELRVDREMEFVHMKDLRAAGVEPTNVISQYKRQDGLGYYESTKDAATHFFFDHLPKGTFVFEYDMRANLKGSYSNGITTIQCMYAPEFTSHSEGSRIKIQ